MIGLAGAVVVGIALFVWLQMASKAALYTAIAGGLITVGLVFLNVRVVTDRERIEQVLHEVAALLRTNAHGKVYEYIHPNAAQAVMRAKSELPNFKFADARVTRVREINVNPHTPPPTAVATFMVVVDVGIAQQIRYKGPRLIRVYFMKRGDQWLVRDYQHTDPVGPGFDQTDFSDLQLAR
jgi:hypothetical protein